MRQVGYALSKYTGLFKNFDREFGRVHCQIYPHIRNENFLGWLESYTLVQPLSFFRFNWETGYVYNPLIDRRPKTRFSGCDKQFFKYDDKNYF
jgi:hypothetical protein